MATRSSRRSSIASQRGRADRQHDRVRARHGPRHGDPQREPRDGHPLRQRGQPPGGDPHDDGRAAPEPDAIADRHDPDRHPRPEGQVQPIGSRPARGGRRTDRAGRGEREPPRGAAPLREHQGEPEERARGPARHAPRVSARRDELRVLGRLRAGRERWRRLLRLHAPARSGERLEGLGHHPGRRGRQGDARVAPDGQVVLGSAHVLPDRARPRPRDGEAQPPARRRPLPRAIHHLPGHRARRGGEHADDHQRGPHGDR